MRLLLSCGRNGLLEHRDGWHPLTCPLPAPDLLAVEQGQLAVVDNEHHLLWNGERLLPVDRGVETLLLWRGKVLTLSGETDCVTLLDPACGLPLIAAPVGVYPQDCCLLEGGLLAVCGGSDGMVHMLRLPSLHILQSQRMGGMPERVASSGGALHVLCAVGDTAIHCHYDRLLPHGQVQHVAVLPGLPGAVCADGYGGVWVAATETLCHFAAGALQPDAWIDGTGLVRHVICGRDGLLWCDPVMENCVLLPRNGLPMMLYRGVVGQALFA